MPVQARYERIALNPAIIPDATRWQRTRLLIGEAGVARLAAARVLVAGLGGVGSYAAEALARAGVGDLRLADCDSVAPSNLNRQLVALHSTLGQPKVDVMARRIADINPDCRVKCIARRLVEEEMSDQVDADLDYVVDAIDSTDSKIALIVTAYRLGIPVVSSMGAGGRRDPTLLRVSDLMDTQVCPLARAVRRGLRRHGIDHGILAVYSSESPVPPGRECTDDGRAQSVNGTVSYLPGLFGLMLAGVAIERLIQPDA